MIRTEKQFRKRMKDIAQDTINDGFDLDQCAGDLADSLWYDNELQDYVRRREPWIKNRLQWREFMADHLVA